MNQNKKTMRRICVIVIVVLAAVVQANAQTPEIVQDTTTKVENETADSTMMLGQDGIAETKNDSAPEHKKKKPDSWWRPKRSPKNDYKECEKELENERVKKLEEKVIGLEESLGSAKAVYDIDNLEFYRNLFTAPLAKKYDSIQVDCYKKTVEVFDHKGKEEMKWVYEVYYPLLENYGQYSRDVAKLIEKVVNLFKESGQPNREIVEELFKEDLENMEYFQKYRYMGVNSKKKDNPARKIDYLEDVIAETRALFEQSEKFTKENFEAQLETLR